MTDDPLPDVEVADSEVVPADTREYELAATATATLSGPDGEVRVRRQYRALPRHNDVVAPGAVDSNDELLARPDEVYVHSEYYTVSDGEADYVRDGHETWRARPPAVLGDAERFLGACRDHHLADPAMEYAETINEGLGREKYPT